MQDMPRRNSDSFRWSMAVVVVVVVVAAAAVVAVVVVVVAAAAAGSYKSYFVAVISRVRYSWTRLIVGVHCRSL